MADQRIIYTEEVVGANHPTKADTLNRLSLVDHNNDGTHKAPLSNFTVDHNSDGTHKNSIISVNKNGVDQTGIVTGTWTLITWGNERYDTNSNFAANGFTPTIADYYFASATITWTGMPANSVIGVAIYLNGSLLEQVTQVVPTSDGWAITVNSIIHMNGTTDSISVHGYQNSGGNEDVQGNIAKSSFKAFRIN